MLKSKFILDIFDLILDEHNEEVLLRQQVPFLTELRREYTGVGVFIYFSSDKEIFNYKVSIDKKFAVKNNADFYERLDGVEIKNNNENILADATLHLMNGIIECIEIWNKNGLEYPLNDPEHYELNQIWAGKINKRTVKR